jgi:hypothetical protein
MAALASKVCKTAASSFFNKDAAKLQALLANTNVVDIKSCQGFKLLSASSDTKLGDALRQMAARNVSSSAFAGHPSRVLHGGCPPTAPSRAQPGGAAHEFALL